jgi:hypothetical protein
MCAVEIGTPAQYAQKMKFILDVIIGAFAPFLYKQNYNLILELKRRRLNYDNNLQCYRSKE